MPIWRPPRRCRWSIILGEVPWQEAHEAKVWYMRMKSRPAFRPLLAEQMRGLRPPDHYAELDF